MDDPRNCPIPGQAGKVMREETRGLVGLAGGFEVVRGKVGMKCQVKHLVWALLLLTEGFSLWKGDG